MGTKFPTKSTTLIRNNYKPELDETNEVEQSELSLYQELIGDIRWGNGIGIVRMLYEISLLSEYQSSPQNGHLEKIIHVFGYLKKRPKLTLYFDLQHPKIDLNTLNGSSKEFIYL